MALSLMQLKRMAEYRAFLDRQKREHEELKVKTHEEQAKAREEQVRSYEVSRQEAGITTAPPATRHYQGYWSLTL